MPNNQYSYALIVKDVLITWCFIITELLGYCHKTYKLTETDKILHKLIPPNYDTSGIIKEISTTSKDDYHQRAHNTAVKKQLYQKEWQWKSTSNTGQF